MLLKIEMWRFLWSTVWCKR